MSKTTDVQHEACVSGLMQREICRLFHRKFPIGMDEQNGYTHLDRQKWRRQELKSRCNLATTYLAT